MKKNKNQGARAWKTGDGLRLMQSQSRKTGRMLTSHCDTNKKRRMTLTAHPLQGSASAKWLLLKSVRRVSRSTSLSPCGGRMTMTSTSYSNSLLLTFQK